jgi:hypothetical protein
MAIPTALKRLSEATSLACDGYASLFRGLNDIMYRFGSHRFWPRGPRKSIRLLALFGPARFYTTLRVH